MDKEATIASRTLKLADADLVTEADLGKLYDPPSPMVTSAGLTYLHDHFIAYLKAASFVCVGTGHSEEIGVSPRGGDPGFIHVIDRKTIVWPEWAGNNKISTLKHLARDPRVGLLFLYHGLDAFMRINGRAVLTRDAELRQRFEHQGKQPKLVVVMTVDAAFFHCGRAIIRSKLWEPASRLDRTNLPSMGQVLKDLVNAPMTVEEGNVFYEKAVKEELYET